MFVGHLGVGLMMDDPRRRIGLGTLFFYVMLLDLLLWGFVLLGFEEIAFPEQMGSMAEVSFRFPYSHSLLASLMWSTLIGCIVFWKWHDRHAALVAVVAVFSHFILDWVVHIQELPLAGAESAKMGLGLGRNFAGAWVLEATIAVAGIIVFLRQNRLSKARKTGLLVGFGFLTVMTFIGQASKTPPPSVGIMAGSSLIAIFSVILFGWWLGKRPVLNSIDGNPKKPRLSLVHFDRTPF
jgi:hypothetical protein